MHSCANLRFLSKTKNQEGADLLFVSGLPKCRSFDESNAIGSGHLLGPDQKSAPLEVVWSLGKLKRSCLMVLAKNSSKLSRAPAMQSSKQDGFWSTTAQVYSITPLPTT